MSSKKVSEFAKLITNKTLLDYLESVSMSVPTQVQADCIPLLMGPGHFTVQSPTGTGKTLGYLLPVISKLKELESQDSSAFAGRPKVVIVAPTRELAVQIFNVAKEISHFSKLRIRKLVGGDKGKSLKGIFTNPIDILVTTPDRCLRSFKNQELSNESMKFLVLDEADQLLEPSFKKTMKDIAYLLNRDEMQLFLVSASRPTNFSDTIKEFFPGLELKAIGVDDKSQFDNKVAVFNIALEEDDKFVYVKDFIKKMKTRNGVIFMGNKSRAKRLFEEIQASGHKKIFLIHKDLEIKERVNVADRFRSVGGILISTDVFARGIDIPHLQWILNFDMPSEPYYYLHRNGRVGRAGRTGEVFNFITSKDSDRLTRINKALTKQGHAELKIPTTAVKRAVVKQQRATRSGEAQRAAKSAQRTGAKKKRATGRSNEKQGAPKSAKRIGIKKNTSSQERDEERALAKNAKRTGFKPKLSISRDEYRPGRKSAKRTTGVKKHNTRKRK